MSSGLEKPEKHRPEQNNLLGALWMLGASTGFATSGLMIKFVGQRLPSVEIAFVRCVMGLIVIAPIIIRRGWSVYRTTVPHLHIIRILCSTVSVTIGIYSFTHQHLATAVALSFTRPLFMILLAHFILDERIHWRRGLATVIGFIGVLIVVGPSDVSSLPAALAGLASAATLAGTMVAVRRQSATDGPATIMVWASTGVCITTALPAFFSWQPLYPVDWGMLAILGVLSTAGNFMMIKAFTHGEATVVNPVDYSQIILTTTMGYLFFQEVPTGWTVLGTAIIVSSTLYIILRDAKLKKAKAQPDP